MQQRVAMSDSGACLVRGQSRREDERVSTYIIVILREVWTLKKKKQATENENEGNQVCRAEQSSRDYYSERGRQQSDRVSRATKTRTKATSCNKSKPGVQDRTVFASLLQRKRHTAERPGLEGNQNEDKGNQL
jgi:hypothetical protein